MSDELLDLLGSYRVTFKLENRSWGTSSDAKWTSYTAMATAENDTTKISAWGNASGAKGNKEIQREAMLHALDRLVRRIEALKSVD